MPEPSPITLRLSEVRLERFKAAFNTKKPIVLRPFNAIIGRNGSGKSSVLEALQWIDVALRFDVRRACDRYNGVHDLINLRAGQAARSFKIGLIWTTEQEGSTVEYKVKIGEGRDGRNPVIEDEQLSLKLGSESLNLISTEKGQRRLFHAKSKELIPFTYPEKLLLGTAMTRQSSDDAGRHLAALQRFWKDAVFLRLSPNELAKSSSPNRPSYAPLLDELGSSLPGLLKELNKDQLKGLAHVIRSVLPDFNGVEVSKPLLPQGEVYYSLTETIPARGRAGQKQAPIPAWMLSEGTRRITAILALLEHDPPPSLLCIEELENGLDPWSVIKIIKSLQSAASRGVQVVVTTHSPWLLDHVQIDSVIHVERKKGETVYSRFADRAAVQLYKNQVPPGAIYATEG